VSAQGAPRLTLTGGCAQNVSGKLLQLAVGEAKDEVFGCSSLHVMRFVDNQGLILREDEKSLVSKPCFECEVREQQGMVDNNKLGALRSFSSAGQEAVFFEWALMAQAIFFSSRKLLPEGPVVRHFNFRALSCFGLLCPEAELGVEGIWQ